MDDITKVKEATDIVGLVGEYLQLKRSGRNYKGLCPFHDEKSPSFHVDPDKGLYYCFGCGQGGDVIGFLQAKEGLSFSESLLTLAKRANIELQQRTGPDFTEAMEFAHGYFREQILCSPRALGYLASRGISTQTVVEFGLGYHDGGLMRAAGANLRPLLVQLGLDKHSFGHRLMMPIRALSGRVVGFSSRALKGETPKYLHQQETALWRRNEHLYGLYEARKAVRGQRVILVEGQFDVLALQQRGYPAVAVFGSEFAANQQALLRRLAVEEVLLAFDHDAAGTKAVLRSLEALRGMVGVRVIDWPAKDPSECSDEQIRVAIDGALSPAQWLYRFGQRFTALDRKLAFFKPWLEPRQPLEALPIELGRLLEAEGIRMPNSLKVTVVQSHEEIRVVERSRALEADIIALLVGLKGVNRQQAMLELASLLFPRPATLLAGMLEALEAAEDVLEAIKRLGGGDVLYHRLMQAPDLDLDDTLPRLRRLALLLEMAYIEQQMLALTQRVQQGDIEAANEMVEVASALEAHRRTYRTIGVL